MGKRPASVDRIDVSPAHLQALLVRIRATTVADEDYRALEAVVETLVHLAQVLAQKRTSLARLRAIVFGACTEKTRTVLARAGLPVASSGTTPGASAEPTPGNTEERTPSTGGRKGHGRNSGAAYTGGGHVAIAHAELKSGDRCPQCHGGKVYVLRDPKVLVRFVGQAPISVTVYALERLRCHLCGHVFTTPAPEGVGNEKYDATTGAMIALLKYGSGVPFHRIEQLQANVRIPLPASTQWEIVAALSKRIIQPVGDELIRQAAQGQVLYNDDTGMTVLSLLGKSRKTVADVPETARVDPVPATADVAANRTGIFTSGIVATTGDGHRIALYFTGRRHAGENLATVLAHRDVGLGPPIQMCDALSRNVPKAFATIVANCLTHARRNVVDVAPDFPAESQYVLETLRSVYGYDARAREQQLSPEARLAFHHTYSAPLMNELHTWCTTQLEEGLVEPNCGLGDAIKYFIKHWTKLTRFLEIPGAPLDSTIVERALKKAILHRKTALFYKTTNGARVGDLFMSVIHTCELNRVNPLDYLVALQRHADAAKAAPAAWMPWAHRATLEAQVDRN